MRWRMALIAATVWSGLAGCDGKDPDRLNRVGKKLVEKSRSISDEARLPKLTIELPDEKKPGTTDDEKSRNAEGTKTGKGTANPAP